MSYHEERAIPYAVDIVCDWCKRKTFLYFALYDAPSQKNRQHKHYYEVSKVISNRKQLLIDDCHICSICVDDHVPFFWTRDGLVHYSKFVPGTTK